MSSVALRKWLCQHPGLAVSLGSLFWLVAGVGTAQLEMYLSKRGTIGDFRYSGDVILSLLVLGIAGSAFAVGIFLGRSGLPVSRTLKSLKYTPVVVVLLFATAFISEVIEQGETSIGDLTEAPMVFSALSLVLMVLQLLGWAVAALVVRRQTRRGRWEVVVPVEAVMPKPSLRESVARHPVWAMNLLTLGTALATIVALVILQLLQLEHTISDTAWLRGTLVTMAPWPLLAALFAATIGGILGRRGQSTQWALVSAFWFPVTLGLPLVLLWACGSGLARHYEYRGVAVWISVLLISALWYAGIVLYIAGQFLGWLVAAGFTRLAVRRGGKSIALSN